MRWNVRDQRREWCPNCNGALWAPLTPAQEAQLSQPSPGPSAAPGGVRPRTAYRWIAVRPGPPPPQDRPRRPLGPTPRYAVMPRWTLMGAPNPTVAQRKTSESAAPSPQLLEKAIGAAIAALGIAAVVHTLIYLLMIINRTRLLHPLVAGAAVWLGRLAGLAAIAAVIWCAVVLTRWLRARRAAAFAKLNLPESRPDWALRAGCLVPLVNVAWAPVYVLELAGREKRLAALRKPIVVWWLVWAASTAAAVFATATSWTDDAQGIANNVVATIFAYLLGLAAVLTAARVVEGFELRSLARPSHHWVVADDRAQVPAGPSSVPAGPPSGTGTGAPAVAVLESDGREPAA